jgi:hypothetical protein
MLHTTRLGVLLQLFLDLPHLMRSEMKFFNLRIRFESAEEGHWTVYITSPSIISQPRKTEMNFALPFGTKYLEHLLDEIRDNIKYTDGGSLRVFRVGNPPNVEYLSQQQASIRLATVSGRTNGLLDLTEALGRDLFIALFKGEDSQAYSIYKRSWRQAIQHGGGLRICLLLPKDGTLDLIPFEYLYDPWDNTYLAKRPNISIVRAVPVQREPKGKLQGFLRLWYISASPEVHSPVNDFDIISDASWDTGLKVIPHPILNASTKKLVNRLGPNACYSPSIIHVSAHGDSGQIFLEQSSTLAGQLAAQFACADKLHLVVFSVCDIVNPLACAMELCRQGATAMTMQFPVTESALEQFLRAFYISYFRDYDLDSAVIAGRGQLANTLEWGTPVVVAPDLPSTPIHKRAVRWLRSFFTVHSLIPRWILSIVSLGLFISLSFLFYQIRQPEPLPPSIQQVVVHTSKAPFKAPDDGQRFPVTIEVGSGTVPIDILASPRNRPLVFTARVLGSNGGRVEKNNQRTHEAQFEYTPTLASTVEALEFCIHEKDQEAMKSCMTVVLDITIIR